jgi:hypothetical protein
VRQHRTGRQSRRHGMPRDLFSVECTLKSTLKYGTRRAGWEAAGCNKGLQARKTTRTVLTIILGDETQPRMASCSIRSVSQNEPDVCSSAPAEAKYSSGILKSAPCANVRIPPSEEFSQETSPISEERKALRRRGERRGGISFGSSQVICISDLSDVVAETFTEEECARRQSLSPRTATRTALVEPSPGRPDDAKISTAVIESSILSAADDPKLHATHGSGREQAVPRIKLPATSNTTQAVVNNLADSEQKLQNILNRTLRDIIAWACSRKCIACGEACKEQSSGCTEIVEDNSTEPELKLSPARRRADERRTRFDQYLKIDDPQPMNVINGEDFSRRGVRMEEVGPMTDGRGRNANKKKPSRRDQTPFNPRANKHGTLRIRNERWE